MKNQEEIVKNNWSDVRGEVQKNWSKLTHDDIEKTKGNVSALSSLVQQKHGVSPDQFDKKFADIVKRFEAGSGTDRMSSQEGQAGQPVEPRQSGQGRDSGESRQSGQPHQGRDSGQGRDTKENRTNY